MRKLAAVKGQMKSVCKRILSCLLSASDDLLHPSLSLYSREIRVSEIGAWAFLGLMNRSVPSLELLCSMARQTIWMHMAGISVLVSRTYFWHYFLIRTGRHVHLELVVGVVVARDNVIVV
jgi:hypothetical protein